MAIRRVDDLAQLERYCHRDSYELYRFQFARYVVFSSASGIRADPHSAANLYSRSRSAHARDVDVRFSHANCGRHTAPCDIRPARHGGHAVFNPNIFLICDVTSADSNSDQTIMRLIWEINKDTFSAKPVFTRKTGFLFSIIRHQRSNYVHVDHRHPRVNVGFRVLFETISLDHAAGHRLCMDRRDVITSCACFLQSPSQ